MKKKINLLLSLCLLSSMCFTQYLTSLAEEVLPVIESNSILEEDDIVTLAFGGDMNFDDNWSTMQYLRKQPNGILDCISPNLVAEMNAVDNCMINNEFTYSTRGQKTAGNIILHILSICMENDVFNRYLTCVSINLGCVLE